MMEFVRENEKQEVWMCRQCGEASYFDRGDGHKMECLCDVENAQFEADNAEVERIEVFWGGER